MIRLLVISSLLFLFAFHSNYAQDVPSSPLELASPAYGSSCGIAGKDPEPRVQLEKMLEAKNLQAIDDWLNSPLKVYQVYAVEGLHRLYKAGYQPTEAQLARVAQIKTDESKVTTCNGCLYSSDSVKRLTARFVFKQT